MILKSQQHLNGDQIVAIDVETTGVVVGYSEICQLSMIPLDNFYNLRPEILPLNIFIRPDCPERIDPEAMKKNRIKRDSLIKYGIDTEKAKDLVEDWIEKLELPYNKYGTRRCRIIPLGHNFGFDTAFLQEWLGKELYSSWFSVFVRDTMTTALFLNDKAAMKGQQVPFSKVTLVYLASQLKVKYNNAHNALADCMATANVYKQMMMDQGAKNL